MFGAAGVARRCPPSDELDGESDLTRRWTAMRRIGIFLTALGVSSAIIVACSDSKDDPPASSPDASIPPDGRSEAATVEDDASSAGPDAAAFGSDSCEACLREKCCDVITDCDQDVKCGPLLQCTLGCMTGPDPGACIDQCKTDHPDGIDKYNAFDTCIATDPPEGCIVSCS